MESALLIERTVEDSHEVWQFDGSRALGPDFWHKLHELAENTSDSVASVTLDGGENFSIGTDLAWLSRGLRRAERRGEFGTFVELGRTARSAFDALQRLPAPLFALCRGAVTGAGAELASIADMRLCLREARVSLPEAKLGMLPDFCSISEIVAALGSSDARRCLLLQDVIIASASSPSPFFDSYPASRDDALIEIRDVARTCARGGVLSELRQHVKRRACGSAEEAAQWNEENASLGDVMAAIRIMTRE